MSLSTWDVRFNSIGLSFGGAGTFGSLSLYGEAGPDRVRMLWGVTGPFGEPDTQVFLPELDGSFTMPVDGRLFNDGTYLIKAIGIDDTTGDRVFEIMNAFFDVNGTVGVTHIGNSRDDLMSGGAGDDTLYGQGGTDWVFGGLGSDLLYGGLGEDFLGGGDDAGADTLNGGGGSDLLAGDGGDDLLLGGTETDYMYGGGGNDSIAGQDGDDIAYGEADNDTLVGGAGNDRMDGDDGNDLLRGDAGDDDLTGDAGNDTLIAGSGVDEYLYGNDGNDRLSGDAGFHRFNGGAGNDTMVSVADGETDFFVYNDVAEGYDRIIGFESDFDILLMLSIQEASVGAGRLVSTLGEIADTGTWIVYEANGRLRVDLNGTDAGELYDVAVLAGTPTLTYGNFILAGAAI